MDTFCKDSKIKLWLKELLNVDDESLPEFDHHDAEVIEFLTQIMNDNMEAEKDAKELIKINEHLAASYEQKGDQLAKIIDDINKSLNFKTPEVEEKIYDLASLACHLNLKEFTLTNFLLSIINIKHKEMKNKEEELNLEYNISKLKKKMEDISKKNKILESQLDTEEKRVQDLQPQLGKIQNSIAFRTNKAEEYSSNIKKFEEKFKALNLDSSLFHRELVKKATVVKNMEEQLGKVKEKLEDFKDVPLHEELLRSKIEEFHLELEQLENEFNDMEEMMGLHLAWSPS